MRALLAILFLSCLTCFGQFGVEQPFFLTSVASGTTSLPTNGALTYDWLASHCPTGVVNSWTDVISSLVMTQATEARRPTNINGGIYFPNSSATDVKCLDVSMPLAAVNSSAAFLIVTSNTTPTAVASPNNYGVFFVRNIGHGIRLRDSGGSVTWVYDTANTEAGSAVVANYGASMPQGVQAVLIFNPPVNSAYTNNVLSITNLSLNALSANTYQLGRGQDWSGASSFSGYVLEMAIWTNSTVMSSANINSIFDYVTTTYGHFNP